MEEDSPPIRSVYWIPVVGWYLNYTDLPAKDKAPKWLAFNVAILLAFVALDISVLLQPRIPLVTAVILMLTFDALLVLVILSGTIFESAMVLRAKDPNNSFLKSVHWSHLVGKPGKNVYKTFLFFNYAEMTTGVVGVTIFFLLRAFV